ncbi:MAG: aryl-sulfate sulfotransferase [Candidatus Heimdallarchaeota archaeon]
MRKSNKILVLCVLALVLTLLPNQASHSASLQEETGIPDFLDESRAETQAAIDVFNTEDSWPGLTMFVVTNYSLGFRNTTAAHLLFVNNQGKLVKELLVPEIRGFSDPQMINDNTFMMQLPWLGPIYLWNLENNTKYTIEAINGTLRGHHDVVYNPVTDTFMTIGTERVETQNTNWTVDTIWEFDWNGDLVWEWTMADWVSDYNATKCQLDEHLGFYMGTIDYSHANTIYWDFETDILYLNPRNLDNVWAIDHSSGNVLWIAGRNGNFTMYDKHGVQKESLWWHSHSFVPVSGELNKFILFDNDLHNMTAKAGHPTTFEGEDFYTSEHSRIVEVVIDPETWTMTETWSWSAPPEYYSPIWGDADRLPNGNRLGTFGSRTHREGAIYAPPYAEGGAALIEVNEVGDIVWQLTFPTGYGIYRARRFQPSLSLNVPMDLTCDQGINDCPGIIWTGKSIFKDYYQITKDGELLVKDTWTSAKIFYELPSDLGLGTHEYTLTVVDLAGQSVSDTIKVTVEATVFEILPTVGISVTLTIGLATVGVMILKRKKPRT